MLNKRIPILAMLALFVLILPPLLVAQTSFPQPTINQKILSKTATKNTAVPPVIQIIIKFKAAAAANQAVPFNASAALARLSEAAGVTLTYARPMSGEAHVLRLPEAVPASEAAIIAAKLAALPDVAYAEPDLIKQIVGEHSSQPQSPNLTPNDSRFGEQWHYGYTANTAEGINVVAAWDITTGISSTVVAVIDTGILAHTELAGRTVPGYDFITDSAIANDGGGRDNDPSDPGDWNVAGECGTGSSPRDSSWHGTHVAGTIGAATNNGAGVAGVNWNAKILPVRVLGKCGGNTSDIVDAIRWAAGLPVSGVPANANPADVINMSLGGQGSCSPAEQNAINDAVAAGATVVVAAGNSNANAANYSPASCNNVITVAATDRTGDRAWYSNFGSVVEVSAPGGETDTEVNGVLSTLDSGTTIPNNDNTYAYYQGTSMAAPHVAGVASLLIGENPGISPAQVLATLQLTARPFPSGSGCTTSNCGSGIVDAYQALNISFTQVYLPVILQGNGSTGNPFINPDFESGSTGWTEFSQRGVLPLIGETFPSGVTPHSGSKAVWLGGLDNEINYVEQTVTVPVSAPYLAYWRWIASSDACGFDIGGVVINGATVVDVYDLCSSANTGGWQHYVVNLNAYAGQTVALQIRAETDSTVNSNLFIDDVSFQSNPTATDTAVPPLFTPNDAAAPKP